MKYINKFILSVLILILILCLCSCFRYRREYFVTKGFNKNLKQMLINFLNILYINNYKPIIFFGTLLGIIRNKDLIDTDLDCDLLLSYEDFERLKNDDKTQNEIKKKYKIFQNFQKTRWNITSKNYNKKTRATGSSTPHLDIYQCIKKDNRCYLHNWGKTSTDTNKYVYSFDVKYINNIIQITPSKSFENLNHFNIPKNYKEILKILYGNWKIKKKENQ